jgi:hypothetical protein
MLNAKGGYFSRFWPRGKLIRWRISDWAGTKVEKASHEGTKTRRCGQNIQRKTGVMLRRRGAVMLNKVLTGF